MVWYPMRYSLHARDRKRLLIGILLVAIPVTYLVLTLLGR